MQPPRQDLADKPAARAAGNGSRVTEVDRLRATCGRQRVALDKLRDAVTILRCGAAALKEQNAELRVELASLRGEGAAGGGGDGTIDGSRGVEAQLTADAKAQSAARRLVEGCL